MRLRVVAVGQRMPDWVSAGWCDYARRFPPHLPLELREVAAVRRARGVAVAQLRERESQALLAAAGGAGRLVVLDAAGTAWSTAQLAGRLGEWLQDGQDVNFLVGGPDGLTRACVERARSAWSLGPLTLPHPLVRLVVAEQLYRAWSITHNHPYHRA